MLPSEFVPLSSQELIAHRKWDSVKKRGHPLCEFCNQTFYEFENLVGHIREAHFLCDFCHASGVFEVFRYVYIIWTNNHHHAGTKGNSLITTKRLILFVPSARRWGGCRVFLLRISWGCTGCVSTQTNQRVILRCGSLFKFVIRPRGLLVRISVVATADAVDTMMREAVVKRVSLLTFVMTVNSITNHHVYNHRSSESPSDFRI